MTDRVIFDTNYYVHLILNQNLEELVLIHTRHHVEIFICEKQLQEIMEVLQYDKIKPKLKQPIADYMELIVAVTTLIEIDERFDRVKDKKDNYLVDLAYTVKAYYLVSGDRHLTSLKHIGKIQIVSPSYFKSLLK